MDVQHCAAVARTPWLGAGVLLTARERHRTAELHLGRYGDLSRVPLHTERTLRPIRAGDERRAFDPVVAAVAEAGRVGDVAGARLPGDGAGTRIAPVRQ